jgi:non-specific serine/threonine protein kinase
MVASLWGYWVSRGRISLGRSWAERALAIDDLTPDFEVLRALYAACALASFQGDFDTAEKHLAGARARAEQLDDPVARMVAEHAAGWVSRGRGDFTAAVTSLNSVTAYFRRLGIPALLMEALSGLIVPAGLAGQPQLAREAFEEAMAISAAHGDVFFKAYALGNWGAFLWMTGERQEVEEVLEECLRAGARIDDQLMAVEVLPWLALLAADHDEPERAAVLFGAADALSRDVGITPLGIPADNARREESVRELELSLGKHRYRRALERGRTMDHAEALSFAARDAAPAVEQPAQPTTLPLTSREVDVAEQVALGLTNNAIAAQLVITPRTVRGHIENILAKLGFSSRSQIATWYAENVGS